MALGWKGMIVAMLAGGAIGVFLSPVVRPAIARTARPALKAAMQAGLSLYEQGREAAAELGEIVEDITAELMAERAESQFHAKEAETAVAAPLN